MWRLGYVICGDATLVLAETAIVDLSQQGIVPGAFLGAVIGLIPGILLLLVLGGGQSYVGLAEVFGFIAMSILAGTVAGALLGGGVAVVLVASRRALRSLRLKL